MTEAKKRPCRIKANVTIDRGTGKFQVIVGCPLVECPIAARRQLRGSDREAWVFAIAQDFTEASPSTPEETEQRTQNLRTEMETHYGRDCPLNS